MNLTKLNTHFENMRYFNNYVIFQFILIVIPRIFGDLGNITELIDEAEELVAGSSTFKLPVDNREYFANVTSNNSLDYGTFDFLIAGGGTAAGVLAYRLTHAGFTVLVIEAGGEEPDPFAILGLTPYFRSTAYNWGFQTTPQTNNCLGYSNQQCEYARGKVLGGCSEINGAMYVRGSAEDYDNWAALGNIGWAYKDVLPYFKLSEMANFTKDFDFIYHGTTGPQTIGIAPDIMGLTSQLLDAFHELGLAELDYNGASQLGYSRSQHFLSDNIRSGSNYSFFRPIRHSPNLNISLNSFVTKVIITNKRAVGVEFVKNGHYYSANALNEVIVSAGAVSSPQILMLSGIGPAAQLEKYGIDVIADLPVGQQLRDHVAFGGVISFPTRELYYNSTLGELVDLWTRDEGPLIIGVGRVIAFVDLDNDAQADIEVFLKPLVTADSSGNFVVNKLAPLIQIQRPLSVGEITLASGDPRDFPLINPNFLSNETDLEVLYQGVQFVLGLNKTLAFQNLTTGVNVASVPDCDIANDKLSKSWWLCVFRYQATTDYHPTGTTRMGTCHTDSVVDSNLKVHGIDRLRVVDAGVMPTLISGHTNAPVVMIAEKISTEIIFENSLL